jgi:hypothetical protein
VREGDFWFKIHKHGCAVAIIIAAFQSKRLLPTPATCEWSTKHQAAKRQLSHLTHSHNLHVATCPCLSLSPVHHSSDAGRLLSSYFLHFSSLQSLSLSHTFNSDAWSLDFWAVRTTAWSVKVITVLSWWVHFLSERYLYWQFSRYYNIS